jgi:hypothetical protein
MTISDLLAEGYTFYRQPEQARIDCPEMRLLEDHLWRLADLLEGLDTSGSSSSVAVDSSSGEWPRIAQWLRMGAGLRYVDVDLAYGNQDPILCRTAADAEAAANDTASLDATELTRLQYTWNSVERLLQVCRLPSVPAAPGRFNAATMLLKVYWSERELPAHYSCVLRHLRAHVDNDPDLRGQDRLRTALKEAPWRGPSGVLLAAANQLRHLPAHGDVTIAEPATWGEEESAEACRFPVHLHAARLAARGLALSVQMLLIATEAPFVLTGWREPTDGWWVLNDDRWQQTLDASAVKLLEQAHLQPPEFDLS